MRPIKFLIQLDEKTLLPSIEGLTIIELCNYMNWYRNKKDYKVLFGFMGRDRVYDSVEHAAKDYRIPSEKVNYNEYIPVGSIEFVRYIKKHLKHGDIKVINIPDELNSLAGRDYKIVSLEELSDMCIGKSTAELNDIIVKPATIAKDFSASTMCGFNLEAVHDRRFFISNKIDIDTEWRVYVHNKRVVNIAKYSGSNNKIDINFVEKCIDKYEKSPKAYTLDIFLTTDGKYGVMEVHNFVSCGFYGFHDPKLLDMCIAGWKYELDRGD